MLLNMHFQKYRSNFENYTYVLWKGSRTKIKHKKRSEMFACNRIFMSSLLCLVFLWPSGTCYRGGINCNYRILLGVVRSSCD